MSSDIAIIGFGFGGLMVLANAVRRATKPIAITIVASDLRGFGVAYSTTNPQHLLNVPARNMSAWASQPDHFLWWLKTPEAAQAAQQLGLAQLPGEDDFAPRALYAHYLASIREQLFAEALEKHIRIEMLQQELHQADWQAGQWQLTLADATRLMARQLVLATGNEVKPIFPAIHHPALVQNPWLLTRERIAEFGRGPVVLVGTGLTAVDTIIALRSGGYAGPIAAIARNGLLPQPHRYGLAPLGLDTQGFPAGGLRPWFRWLRQTIRLQARAGNDWRMVVDALRPHTQSIWQSFPVADQQRTMRRLGTFWNIHRHRMAPEIAVLVKQEITAGKLRLLASRSMQLGDESDQLKLGVQTRDGAAEIILPAAIINCTGPELNWAKSSQPLLQHLLQQNAVRHHATAIGVVADAQYRVGKNLYTIGGLMTGQFWESTAVPELRAQAATIGEALCRP